MLEPQQEYMLAKSWREHGDRDAAHKLVTSHLRLVAKIAMGYRGYGLPISEVISEGNVGLMQAVKRFEPEKGFRLATYAMWWIKASIQEYILRSWSLVKMGTTANQKKLFFNLRKAKSKISALDEGDLRPDQVKLIAKRLGVGEQDVIDMNRRLGGDMSLNAPIRNDGDAGEWQDWLVDDRENQETILAEHEELDNRRQALTDALSVLNERERRIFEARRLAEDPVTLEELAEEFGVSRERVRQIEVRAFEKVQKAVKKRVAAMEQPNAQPAAPSHWRRTKAPASRRTASRLLLPPGRECVGEHAIARRAFFDRQNGAAIVVVNDRDIEPRPLLEQLNIALHVRIGRREPDQEESGRHLDRKTRKRDAAGLLGLLHQHAADFGYAAVREIRRQVNMIVDRVARRQRPCRCCGGSIQVIVMSRSGILMSAWIARSGGWPGPARPFSVRQTTVPKNACPWGSSDLPRRERRAARPALPAFAGSRGVRLADAIGNFCALLRRVARAGLVTGAGASSLDQREATILALPIAVTPTKQQQQRRR